MTNEISDSVNMNKKPKDIYDTFIDEIMAGDITKVANLLPFVDVNASNGIALYFACKSKSPEMAKLLIDNKADVNIKGGFAFQHAIKNNNINIIKLLMNHDVNPVVMIDNKYEHILIGMSMGCKIDTLKLVLDYGKGITNNIMDICIKNAGKNRSDIVAILETYRKQNTLPTIDDKIRTMDDLNLDSDTLKGFSDIIMGYIDTEEYLEEEVKLGHVENVAFLMKNAKIESYHRYYMSESMHNEGMINVFTNAGCIPLLKNNARFHSKNSELHSIFMHGYINTVKNLIKAEVDLYSTNYRGERIHALYYIENYTDNRLEIFRMVLDYDKNIDKSDIDNLIRIYDREGDIVVVGMLHNYLEKIDTSSRTNTTSQTYNVQNNIQNNIPNNIYNNIQNIIQNNAQNNIQNNIYDF
jgi:hypothetical protein